MKPFLSFVLFVLLGSTLQASGWNDYKLEIGDGYCIAQLNSMDVCIGKGSTLILFPSDHPGVGPVVAYQMLEKHILAKNAGSTPRNHFVGDTFQDVDYQKEWFFIVPKDTNKPLGPFKRKNFEEKLSELGLQQGEWIQPKNPNFWTPFLGGLMFILIAVFLILPIKYFYISIPLIAFFVWLRRKRRKNHKK